MTVAVSQEFPRDRLMVSVDSLDGTKGRWADDESQDSAISGLKLVDEMPGGEKELSGALPRDPRVELSDTEPYGEVTVKAKGGEEVWGPGQINVAEGSEGDHLVLNPACVGYSVALEDNEAVQLGMIDRDLSKWGDPSTQRKLDALTFWSTKGVQSDVGWSGPGTDPGILNQISFEDGPPLAESEYDSGGIPIGQVLYDFTNVSGERAGTVNLVRLAVDDRDSSSVAGKNHGNATAVQQSVSAPNGSYRYALTQTAYEGPYTGAGIDKKLWKNLCVVSWLAAQSLHLLGTWPNVGFTAKQILGLAVPLLAPPLEVTEESLEDDGYLIPQAWWSDPTTMANIVNEVTKYGLLNWFCHGRTFNLRRPGAYGRKWQAYAGPSRLKPSTGRDGARMWESIVVQWQDVSGVTTTAGPIGSGARFEVEGLRITDPDHPAVRSPRNRQDLLVLNGVGTLETSLPAAERWLTEANELDHSGECSLTGFVLDDKGIYYPASYVRGWDMIRFPDAADKSYRRISRREYDDTTKTVNLSLDAPAESLQALNERYNADLVPLGL